HLIWLDADDHIIATSNTNNDTTLIDSAPAIKAAQQARIASVPQYSQPYNMVSDSTTTSVDTTYIDYSVPLYAGNQYLGSLISTYATASILNDLVPWWFAQDNQIELIDTDDIVIASRASGGPGRDVYTHRRPLDLPGLSLILRTNSTKDTPKFLPTLLVGSVIALALGLLWSLLALWRDIHRRLATEDALRHEVAFRSAMENSLVTGLRARDLEGRVTYVNPAFCDMMGMRAEDIIGKSPPMS
ncbi:MAG: PAS domain S-box protein, partial [Glaciimonas sp.]|nr:PAS domain S-box protein [Glaciimonas sp.]